jgi:hypothetical protein
MKLWGQIVEDVVINTRGRDKVLRNTGFERKQSGKGTSHYRYVLGTDQIVVPRHGNHVKEVYQLARSVGPTNMQGPAQDETSATVTG